MADNKETNHYKKLAGERAAEFVQSGMVVGLGVGSTAIFALHKIASRIERGELKDILGIPCSKDVEAMARLVGIPLTTLEEHPQIDVTIDGADEVDPQLNLIKGGGGALLREKIVAQASLREIIVVDEGKLSPKLGSKWPLPVEVVSFGWGAQAKFIDTLGGRPTLRTTDNKQPYLTDQGNAILDCDFGAIDDLEGLARQLEGRAGIVEHGLFLGLATDLIVAGAGGSRHQQREGLV